MAKPSFDAPSWADSGTIVEPSSGKKEAGWSPEERPPAEFLNWWQNRVGGFLQYLANAYLMQLNFTDAVFQPTTGFAVEGIASNGIVTYLTASGSSLFFTQGQESFWQITSPASSGIIRDIAYLPTPGLFVTCEEGTNGIRYFSITLGFSPGNPGTLSYTTATYVGGAPTAPMRAIHWEESIGLGVAVGGTGGTGPADIYTSTDGITWTKRTTPGTTYVLFDVMYGNGVWIAVGNDSSGNEHIIRSTDGITWSAVTLASPVNDEIESVAYDSDNDVWLTTGDWFTGTPGQYQRVWTSTDGGLTWTNQSANLPENTPIEYDNTPSRLYQVIYDPALGGFVVGDSWGLLLTVDGTSWTRLARIIGGTTPPSVTIVKRCHYANGTTQLLLGKSNDEVLHGLVVPSEMG